MKKILIISYTHIDKSPRVVKQIEVLKSKYDLYVSGYSYHNIDSNIKFIPIERSRLKMSLIEKSMAFFLLLAGKFDKVMPMIIHTKNLEISLNENEFDLIICHSLGGLHLLSIRKNKSKVLFDAHEYFKGLAKGFLQNIVYNKMIKYQYKNFINEVNHIDTVCESIAGFYQSDFPNIPVSYTFNTPKYNDISIFNNEDKVIRLIHHGIADPNRELERMIAAVSMVENDVTLDLMLVFYDNSYKKKLLQKVAKTKNVRIIDPVNPNEIVTFINQYDIGFYILNDKIPNMKYALPNKLFEFIQARLMVLIGPSVEMSKVVKSHNVGIIAESFEPEEFTAILNKIDKNDVVKYKVNANKAAKILCAEEQMKKLSSIVDNLVSD